MGKLCTPPPPLELQRYPKSDPRRFRDVGTGLVEGSRKTCQGRTLSMEGLRGFTGMLGKEEYRELNSG